MILIFSTDIDPSTNHVIDWLNYFNKDWKRINNLFSEPDLFPSLSISSSKKELQFNSSGDNLLEKTNAVWFRRFDLSSDLTIGDQADINLIIQIRNNFYLEKRNFYEAIDRNILQKKRLNKLASSQVSKILQLEIALEVKLQIPSTLITTNKKDLTLFYEKHSRAIIKPIDFTPTLVYNNKSFVPFTTLLTREYIHDLEDSFYPTLCQEHIEKEFEIRSFYIDGTFYSMALFSQDNEKTAIDSRNYDSEKPTRRIPYKLPQEIEQKLILFCRKLEINCGSIDLIKSKTGEFYFLEINPLGQFGFVSVPCNYNLHKKIAEFLIK